MYDAHRRRPTSRFCGAVAIAAVVACVAATGAEDSGPMTPARFHERADASLEVMLREAGERKMQGVAIIAFVPGDRTAAWVSQMRAVDTIVVGQANVLAIASCKLAEMADTLQDSGSKVRPPLHGENGYRGGAIRKVPGGYLLAAFSGGKDTDDLDVANLGLDALEKTPTDAAARR